MTGPAVSLDGSQLDLETAWRVSRREVSEVGISESARERVRGARRLVEDFVARGEVVYGITTGFGRLKNVVIPRERTGELQRNLIRSHAVGVGQDSPPEVVRLLLLLRLNALLHGNSGVRELVLDQLAAMIRHDILPVVPQQGSVGASGDLAPLAHLALVIQGEGEADVDGMRLPGREALARHGLEPVELAAKEGLGLINGTQFSTAFGLVALERAVRLAKTADLACALTIDAHLGSLAPFADRVARLRPHPGHAATADNVRRLLAGSEIMEAHAGCGRVQDAYSLRCAPQVHGAARDALTHVREALAREVNSVTDNPLIFPEDGDSVSAGNFHAEPVALPLDYAACAVQELASISERRIERLVNPDLSHLPAFLAAGAEGVNSGLMMAQVTAAALVSENKVLCHPASIDSLPTSANQEDHVSMAPIAARKLEQVTRNALNVLAIEVLTGWFAIQHRRPARSGRGVEAALEILATEVPVPDEDRVFKHDIDRVAALIESGTLVTAAEAAVGPLVAF